MNEETVVVGRKLAQEDSYDLNDDADFYDEAAASSSYIQYWNDYAIRPIRCIVHQNVDVIMYSLYEKGYEHCSSDTVLGTYITPVGDFVDGYLDQRAQALADKGYEEGDYEEPEVAQYKECTPFQMQNNQYLYMQLGCSDVNNQKLAVNIYEDNTCTQRSTSADGYDDSNIDASGIKVCNVPGLFNRPGFSAVCGLSFSRPILPVVCLHL